MLIGELKFIEVGDRFFLVFIFSKRWVVEGLCFFDFRLFLGCLGWLVSW